MAAYIIQEKSGAGESASHWTSIEWIGDLCWNVQHFKYNHAYKEKKNVKDNGYRMAGKALLKLFKRRQRLQQILAQKGALGILAKDAQGDA